MIPSRACSSSVINSNISMSYRLCCGTLSHSDLSLSVGEPPLPPSQDTGESPPAEGQPSPPVENIAEICQHPIEVVDDTSSDGAFKFDFKNTDSSVRSKSKTVPVVRRKGDKHKDTTKKSSKFWTKFRKLGTRSSAEIPAKETPSIRETGHCECTGYRKTEDHVLGPGVTFNASSLRRSVRRSAANASPLPSSASRLRLSMGAGPGPSALARAGDLLQMVPAPPAHRLGASVLDLSRFNPDDFPTEDVDEIRIAQRARDIELGVEISPRHIVYPHLLYGGGSPPSNSSTSPTSSCHSSLSDPTWNLAPNFQAQCVVTSVTFAHVEPAAMIQSTVMMPSAVAATAATAAAAISTTSVAGPPASNTEITYSEYGAATGAAMGAAPVLPATMPPPPPPVCAAQPYIPQTVHTQIDYIHCLVPDLNKIASCGFYWGVMDRYEAERLLENRPEGTFLLRDSAQEEFLFSVSFRRYDRSLHARIEQWNHKFSFDSHDPGVYAAESVTSLIEHYKDPSCCMFFEPLLTIPLNRTFPFSLQHLCRSVICAHSTYDGLNFLPLPKAVRDYLKYYHYKQKVRVRRFEMSH